MNWKCGTVNKDTGRVMAITEWDVLKDILDISVDDDNHSILVIGTGYK